MKKTIIALCAFLFMKSMDAQVVQFDDEVFKTFIIDEGFDTNEDGEIQIAEAEQIVSLEIVNNDNTSIVGIKEFKNLEELLLASPLTTIDIEGMESLTSLTLNIDNEVDVLNASYCANLMEIQQ